MVHDESHLISWHDMFLLECECEMLSEHCMCT